MRTTNFLIIANQDKLVILGDRKLLYMIENGDVAGL